MEKRVIPNEELLVPELYFLISKFLSNGPFQQAAEVLIAEVEKKKTLPKRIDWTGQEHYQTFAELERKYPHIGPQHLLEICGRISSLLEKEVTPSVPGIISLLGAGKQSLLRTKQSVIGPKNLVYHCTRLRSLPLMDSTNRQPTNNIVQVLYGRESSGAFTRKKAVSTNFYSKLVLLRSTLGHLSAVYCVLFDRSGKYIITGADDLLVKLWSAIDGRLLATFRGASAEITDIAVNLENTLLAAGSLDRFLRVWDMQTAGPIAVLSGHTGMITSVNFCPSPKGELKYLVTTSTDGSVAFWQYCTPHVGKTSFASKPIQYHEKLRPGQAQMICASFSPGGQFLAAGSADHHVRVYIMAEEGPKRILETEAHTDTVDSIQWAHNGLKFISGSKDGMALVWHFEAQQWKSMKLNMAERLPNSNQPEDESRKVKVTMVSWDYTDEWVITAVNDFTIKVWNANTGKLHRVMLGHTDELYVLESHPKDPHVLVSAGHDGQLFVWDIFKGEAITSFANHIEGQGHGGVFDAKWSPDGSMIAATDSHGHILMYGFGSGHERLKLLPKELFFHTDYRPLIRDANHFVVDEQTQTMPHLMPPPFLVDVDGNPHPPSLQRLVPGRENCTNEQLVPNISVGPEGVEVIENGNSVSNIDRLIAALANRQEIPGANNDPNIQQANNRPFNGNARANGNRVGLLRYGDVQGVRQSSGNWQRESTFKWIRRTYVQPLQYSRLQSLRQAVYVAGQQEQAEYKREMRRRPLMINTSNASSKSQGRPGRHRRQFGASSVPRPAYRTRAVREREHVEEEDDEAEQVSSVPSDDSSDVTAAEEEFMSESSCSDTSSSDYSDWVANDQPGQALEPPKRSKKKPCQPNRTYPTTATVAAAATNNDPSTSDTNNHQNNNKPPDKKKLSIPIVNGEIPEFYRPPEWLSEVIPRKAPYYPQMGDEVVYLRQGHQRYLEAVRNKKVYKISNASEPWIHIDLREHERVKVIGIKYEIRPPRLCCLKLALMNNDGSLTGPTFTIKYHDMPDVLDFIVLLQTFETAVRRLWTPGDRFRCMIDDGWWIGRIESRVALSPEFPNSLFMCFRIRWDNGEYEFMSPWDMEPVDQNRQPDEIGGAVPVLPEELRATLYQPKAEEWPRGDRDASCRRIIIGLEEVMGLAIADPFLAPVDLNIYPEYAFVVEYPIDLATIKARFDNHFYRRITSAQFDVRYLATNAEKFNQTHSHIVRHARIITDLCLRIIKEPNAVDVRAVYHQLVDTYVTSDSDNENHHAGNTSSISSTTRRSAAARRSKRLKSDEDWRVKCRKLLEMIWQCDDSTPFREPVDTLEHPDYLQCVDTPMDLRTVKEDLLGGNYESAANFVKDMRLIFTNSRNYNTNKRSRIYSMTLRISNLFEDQLKTISNSWKSPKNQRSPRKKLNNDALPLDHNQPGPSKMITRATTSASAVASSSQQSTTKHINVVDDEEDDDDDDDDDDYGVNIALPRNGGGRGSTRKNQIHNTNGLSPTNDIDMAGPSTSSGIRKNASRSQSQEIDYGSESSESLSSSGSDNDDDDDSDGSHGIPLASLGVSGRQRKTRLRNSDSEDSYKPNRRRTLAKKAEKRTQKKSRRKRQKDLFRNSNGVGVAGSSSQPVSGRPVGRPPKSKRAVAAYTDDDEDYNIKDRDFDTPKKRLARPKRNTKRLNSESSNNNTDVEKQRRTKKPQRHQTDHSYHLNASISSSRQQQQPHVESGSDNERIRPTRSATKKTSNNKRWQDGEGDDGDDSFDETTNERLTSNTLYQEPRGRYNMRSAFLIDPNEDERTASQNTASSSRSLRSTRNQISEDDDSDDDQVLSQLSLSSDLRTKTPQYRDESHSANGTIIPRTTNRRMRRSPTITATITSSSMTNTSVPAREIRQSIINADHDYGEPGPSSMRHSLRRTLSRHQRNADELDREVDLYSNEQSNALTAQRNVSSRLRQRQLMPIVNTTANTTATTSSMSSTTIVSTNDLHINNPSNDINDDDEVDDDDDDDDDDNDDEDVSDPDDNKPLTYVASLRHTNSVSTVSRSAVASVRKRIFSDDENIAGPSSSTMSSRSTRTKKRPYYNEDSDDSTPATNQSSTKRRFLNISTNEQPTTDDQQLSRRSSIGTISLNNHSYSSRSSLPGDENENSDEDAPVKSVSSRGRIRKITAKARGLFRE